jgi:hypothetical protein
MPKVDRTDANTIYVGKIKLDNDLKECAMYILKELEYLGIYITYVSKYSSTYFKFEDGRLGSLRMADHKGVKNPNGGTYNFKWNLYCDKWEESHSGKWKTHWYHVKDAYKFVQRVKKYARTIQINDEMAGPVPPVRELPPIGAYEDRYPWKKPND